MANKTTYLGTASSLSAGAVDDDAVVGGAAASAVGAAAVSAMDSGRGLRRASDGVPGSASMASSRIRCDQYFNIFLDLS